MKVFLEPTGLHSIAMNRVVTALSRRAPEGVEIVKNLSDADLQVHHIVGHSATVNRGDVVIQYCLRSMSGCDAAYWIPVWDSCKFVWSYYDLPQIVGFNGLRFMYAPLGVEFIDFYPEDGKSRYIDIMTSGYVTGPGAEAIEEVAIAASSLNYRHLHLGPATIEGMTRYPQRWTTIHKISDVALRKLYSDTLWVSGLRHVEGFELPAIEGLLCGARPIVFDRPEMNHWYGDHATYIPEAHGEELIEILTELLRYNPKPVTQEERDVVAQKFNWDVIAKEFWDRVTS